MRQTNFFLCKISMCVIEGVQYRESLDIALPSIVHMLIASATVESMVYGSW